jgi:pyruvate kinase
MQSITAAPRQSGIQTVRTMKVRQIELLCTLGPASLNDKVIHWLERAGTSLLRLNLSHTKIEDVERILRYIHERTHVPVCLDTEGAQVRTGPLVDGKVTVRENRFLAARARPAAGDQSSISLYPPFITSKLQVGDFINIDFNAVLSQVVEKDDDQVVLRILHGGEIGQNKAVTVQRPLDMPPLTEKDIAAIEIGRRMGIRHFALSFAHRGSDVDLIRHKAGADAIIISKIECLSGLRNLASIAQKSDAILIDRGDLSREVPIEQMPAAQKMIIRSAKARGAKVYVATNLLESMTSAPTPTRAEVNDIYNTLADGADGLVLAAETAIGQYPVNCARMVVKVVEQFQRSVPASARGFRVHPSSLLAGVEPHGGRLVCRTLGPAEYLDIKELPAITVGDDELTDVEQVARGTFSPLRGFMDKACLESVLEHSRLPSGLAWTMPIVLAVPKETANRCSKGDRVLLSSKSGMPHSVLDVSETYEFEPELLGQKWFGTASSEHPGVARVLARGRHFLSGDVTLIQSLPCPYRRYDLTPAQLRTVFAHKGWSRVVAFHTRNVVHRGHEAIQIEALERTYADGLLINPVVGSAKRGDFAPHLVLEGYQAMLDYGLYPPGKVVLASFMTYPRFAGPREAVFTALCRKNMGCSHFIVGRDHSGVGGFYGASASRKMFDELGDLGIEPIFFDAIGYDTGSERYVDLNACETARTISGTEIRRALHAGEALPNWMMRSEVQDMVRAELMMKHAVFQE